MIMPKQMTQSLDIGREIARGDDKNGKSTKEKQQT